MSREKRIEIPEDEKSASGYSKLAWKLWEEVKLPMTQCETIDRIVREEGYRKVIRCKDCEYHHWEQEPCHGKTIHKCSVLNAEVFKDFYCYYGKPKTKGGAE